MIYAGIFQKFPIAQTFSFWPPHVSRSWMGSGSRASRSHLDGSGGAGSFRLRCRKRQLGLNTISFSYRVGLEAIAIRLEAIAVRLEALEAIASSLEAIASSLEAIAISLEAIASSLEAIASSLEAIAMSFIFTMRDSKIEMM